MVYEYSGDLKHLLDAPDPDLRETLPHIEFTAEDFQQWHLIDSEADPEWQHIPGLVEKTNEGAALRGHFEDVRRIDTLDRDDPSFWVPLSSLRSEDARFPIDTAQYPIIEITYRCTTPMARPAWLWHYPGGVHFDGLQPTRTWRTIARRISHFGFPARITALTVRLYSTARSTEGMEIQSIRCRAYSPLEAEACRKRDALIDETAPPKRYSVLESFSPVGVYMKAGTAKRMAKIMDISMEDYWRLTLEDIARHSHNCIAFEEIEQLSADEWVSIQAMAESYGIRFLAIHSWNLDDFETQGQALIDKHIRPYINSKAIFAWSIQDEPSEHAFAAHLRAQKMIEEIDPYHPVTVMMREPNSFPLFAPFLPAAGMAFFGSNASWHMGDLIRAHIKQLRGQQFWLVSPAFVYGTDTPSWSTCPEMRLMINLFYASGGRGWFAFAYHNDPIWLDGHCQRSLTGPFLTFSDLWSELGHRMERFSAMAPLFLNASPDGEPEIDIEIASEPHAKAKRPEGVPSICSYWIRGSDYALLYVISNDIGEVTPVYFRAPEHLADDIELYDVTDFVRNRVWKPMSRVRHLEMFPGQGQVILAARRNVCAHWRNVIGQRILDGDRRQIALDLELAREYHIEISAMEHRIAGFSGEATEANLAGMQDVRDELLNRIYATPAIIESRSRLIQASAAICGCDGTLCRLLGMGKVDLAHELGLRVPPLARELTALRVKLRQGEGAAIKADCVALAQRTIALLTEIRAVV